MNRSSRRAWLRAEGDADSLPPPDEFMGCDIISQGSLCSKERRRRLLALLMKQFIRWGWSYCMLPRQAGGGGGCPVGRCRGGWQPCGSSPGWGPRCSIPAWGAAEGLPPSCSQHTVLAGLCLCVPVACAACSSGGRWLHRSGTHSGAEQRAQPWAPAVGLPWAGEATAGAGASLPCGRRISCWKRPCSALAWGAWGSHWCEMCGVESCHAPRVWKRAGRGFGA